MDKVLVILPDDNKGKYIAKGYSDAFRAMSYFVIEKKIYDLNLDEVNKMAPNIIFIFWHKMSSNEVLTDFMRMYDNDKSIIINAAELIEEIPLELQSGINIFNFSSDSRKKKYRILPAVMSEAYKRKISDYKYMITFSGNPAEKGRERLLSRIIYNFGSLNVFCRSFDFYKSVDEIYKNKFLDDKYIDLYRESYRGYVESQKELSYIYSHSKVNIDMPAMPEKNINYRCMEIMASGGFLIAPYNKTIIKYFEDGKEFETYKSDVELIDKIRFYIKNVNLALLIASKGRKNVVSNHSFYDRLKLILKVVNDKDTRS